MSSDHDPHHHYEHTEHDTSPPCPPPRHDLEPFLDQFAPFSPIPLVPELRAFTAKSLVDVWAAAEALCDKRMPSPFWAYPWAAGTALARIVLDHPDWVRGLSVFDFGAGGGIASCACALAGAARVVANDIDPWAVAVTRIAAERQGLTVEGLLADAAAHPELVDGFNVVLCGDLAYDKNASVHERALLERAAQNGARLLVADAGRTYFDDRGFTQIARFDMDVPTDLEGGHMRSAIVYERSST